MSERISEILEHLPRYCDGRLPTGQRAAIDAQLAADGALRAEWERCAKLRASLNRIVAAERPSPDLRSRICMAIEDARRPARRNVLRSGMGVFALAAAVALAAFLTPSRSSEFRVPAAPIPPVPGVVVVGADAFSTIHKFCSIGGHDMFHVGGKSPSAARSQLSDALDFPFAVPDLSAHGLELDCACSCFPSRHVSALHASYHRGTEPDETISVFSFNRPLSLNVCAVPPPAPLPGGRSYDLGRHGGVTVLTWDEGDSSFAVAGRMDVDQLAAIADASGPAARLIAWALSIRY